MIPIAPPEDLAGALDAIEAASVAMDFDKPWRLGQEVFTGARLPQDRDIVQCVVDILRRAGHPDPDQWTWDPSMNLAIAMPPEGQIFLINRYWRLVLAEMPCDTMLQRRALMDIVASYSDYLNGFEVAVAPYVVPAKPDNAGIDSLKSVQE